MSQIEVTKLNQFAVIGADEDEATVAKLVMYALLTPGDPTGETPDRQAHVYAQVIGN